MSKKCDVIEHVKSANSEQTKEFTLPCKVNKTVWWYWTIEFKKCDGTISTKETEWKCEKGWKKKYDRSKLFEKLKKCDVNKR